MPAPNLDEVQVPCSLFLGLNTEVAPPDLPEGVSPDNQDVAFVPGSVFSRPCLHKLFSQKFGGNPTYIETFAQPNEDPLNLYMTADGAISYEDILNNPNTYLNLGQIIPGLYAQSVTANGTEYIAVSDGSHGADIPRQVYRTPDGTLRFDRVSQDGPGVPPTVQNAIPPTAAIASGGAGPGIAVSTITPTDKQTFTIPQSGLGPKPLFNSGKTLFGTASGSSSVLVPVAYYTTLTVVTSVPHNLQVGNFVSITGNSLYNFSTQRVTVVVNGTTFKVAVSNPNNAVGNGGTITQLNPSLSRNANIVTANTAAAHGFQAGWQVQITGIVNVNIGGGIASIARDAAGNVTVTTTTPHGLVAGAMVNITGVTNPDSSFNTPVPVAVQTVINPTQFTYQQGGTQESSTMASGNVQDVWNTTAFVQTTPSSTTFTYQQLGPDDSTSTSGTATILGQVSPGQHQLAVLFLTRSGYLTKPSPPVTFNANGQQQLLIQNIPLGPSNVVARILAFTGSGGAFFFYLPITPIVNGQIVGSSTVITDNLTTSLIVDFADTSLFAGVGISIPGNNLFAQVVLGPALGVFFFASRLWWWGQRNKIQNFLNMGFEGGTLSGSPDIPLGWTIIASGGALVAGESGFGLAWQITGAGLATTAGGIRQPAFQDAFNIPITQPNTQYSARCFVVASQGATGKLQVDLFSPGTGTTLAFCQYDVSTFTTTGNFVDLVMTGITPALIPNDAVLRVFGLISNGATVTVDEIELYPTFNPFLDSTFMVSYVNNLEAYDGVTGNLGPTSDANPIKGCETIRDGLQFLTSGGMHSTSDNGQEPSNWTVNEISNDVGLVANRAIDAGEECIIWVSRSGGGNGQKPTYALRIYEGAQPWKISQEVQSLFDQINPAAEQTIWLINDIGQRRIYIGVPTGTATAPNLIYVLDYREIDTAFQLATSGSIHISFTGKMIASDLARKWTKWNVQANCGAMLARPGNSTQFCVGAGNGVTPGQQAGFNNVYFFDPAKYTDDDYGTITPYYVMYFFISRDAEQALGVGSMRKLYKRLSAFISGIGNVTFTPYAASLQNPWPSTLAYLMALNPTSDLYSGLNVSTERMAIKITPSPLVGTTDVQFNLEHLHTTVQQHPVSPFGTGAGI